MQKINISNDQYKIKFINFFSSEEIPSIYTEINYAFSCTAKLLLQKLPVNDEQIYALEKLAEAKIHAIESLLYKKS